MSELDWKKTRETLLYSPKHGYDRISQQDRAEMAAYCADYLDFIDRAKTEREAVQRAVSEAEAAGFPHVHLTPVQKLEPAWRESEECGAAAAAWLAAAEREKRFILDVNDPAGQDDTTPYAQARGLTTENLRVRISGQLGKLVQRVLDGGLDATILCTGGDTLLALMRTVGVAELRPVCELDTGAVLTDFVYHGKTYHIISKSGGFGEPDLFIRLARSLGAGEETEDATC